MDACQRKRTRPAQITSRVVLRPPPQQHRETPAEKRPRYEVNRVGLPDLNEFSIIDWCEIMEEEVERRVAERMENPQIPVFNPKETIFLNSTHQEGNIEVLTRAEETFDVDKLMPKIPSTEYDPKRPSVTVECGGSVILEEYDPATPSFETGAFCLPETPPPSATMSTEKEPFCFPAPKEHEGSPEDNRSDVANCSEPEFEDPRIGVPAPFNCGIPVAGDKAIMVYVRDVCKVDPNYRPIPLGPNKKKHFEKKLPNVFETECIPRGSLYWREMVVFMREKPQCEAFHRRSSYDHARVSLYWTKDKKLQATRNFTNVIIADRHGSDFEEEDVRFSAVNRIVGEFPKKVQIGKIPTEMIPWNSNYYSELLVDETFPFYAERSHIWVHKKGRDGVPVHFRLAKHGRSLFAMRNGVLIQLYPHF